MKRVLIIGGGIVGLATAYKLGKRFPHLQITLLEKEPRVGAHQSGNNSGVMHSGLYYKPDSSKAKLAVSGLREMTAFCRENNIPHDVCGKLVVATDASELPRLKMLMERGAQNGLENLRWLNSDEIAEFEPHARGVAALRVPQTGIADYPRVCEVLAQKIAEQGGRVVTSGEVKQLSVISNQWIAQTTAGDFAGDFLLTCAGLHADRVAELAGEARGIRIVPFRGEYYRLKKSRAHMVRNLIYPVPDPRFPFLGVHFTRRACGGVECGPNAVLAFAREGYRKTDFNARDLMDAASYSGFWHLIARHWRMAASELQRSLSKNLFAASLQKLVPEIQAADLEAGGAGVRAQAIDAQGNLVEDFLFIEHANALHVLNAPSPAATASLAIGDVIADKISNRF
ncbi:MAG: L-2-hydroxyglutarate oxidase [Chloroflexi bacterium]|nr:L-2-hydroxyglutarate oxidase [Chloroflexota bacterium]